MNSVIVAFFLSFTICLLIIKSKNYHSYITADYRLSDPQKFHNHVVPRIGGFAIFFGIFAASLSRNQQNITDQISPMTLFLCTSPIWLIGTLEDVTKKISVRNRLITIIASSAAAAYILNTWITRIDMFYLDLILTIPLVSYILTCVAITGLTNAYNIIDGLNGLTSIVASTALLAIAYVALKVNDHSVLILAMIMLTAILGFFIWNYPKGLIFLGDGGAYLIGFWIAITSILLVERNPSVSPWSVVVINIYPITETLFSIWRKKVHKNKSPTQADGCHLHSLIYRRIIRKENILEGNSSSSPVLWVLNLAAIIPAIFWWQHTSIMLLSTIIFIVAYVHFYLSIIRFKIPKWVA